MWSKIGKAIWSAVTSPKGKAVLSLGASWLIDRLGKGSPKARQVIAITAHEFPRLKALAKKTGTPVDDLAIMALEPGLQSAAHRQLVRETVAYLEANPGEVAKLIANLPLKPPPE